MCSHYDSEYVQPPDIRMVYVKMYKYESKQVKQRLGCIFRKGIPLCGPHGASFSAGFDPEPCSDPFLHSCDNPVGIPGYCCPIGTLCFTNTTSSSIFCVDALGGKTMAFPANEIGAVPPSTAVPSTGPEVVFSPPSAWSESPIDAACTSNKMIYTTNVINATVSFVYFGPSVEVHMLTSLDGGVFSVIIDGLNTTTIIDTYAGNHSDGSMAYPRCYPNRYPPVALIPTQYASKSNHTITLVLIGASPNAEPLTNGSKVIGQFNGFAIPDLSTPIVMNGATLSSLPRPWISFLLTTSIVWIMGTLMM